MAMDFAGAKHIVNVSGSCFDYVTPFGGGVWNEKYGESIIRHSLFRLHVQFIIMFCISHFLHLFLKRFHFQRITSDIVVISDAPGMILGETLLARFYRKETERMFPKPNQVVVQMSKVGYVTFTFMAAVRMDPRLVKSTGIKPVILAVAMTAIPRSIIQTMQVIFIDPKNIPASIATTNVIDTRQFFNIISNSWFVGVSTILREQKITNSRLGHTALSSALLAELMKTSTNVIMNTYLNAKSTSYRMGIQVLVSNLMITLFIVYVIRPVLLFFIKRTPEGKLVSHNFAYMVIAMMLMLASIGDPAGTSYLQFPIFLGLVVPAGSPLASSLVAKVDTIIAGFFIPLMTMYTASKFDLIKFIDSFHKVLHFQTTLIAYAIKLAGTFLTALCLRIPLRDAAALSLIVNIKSVVEIGYIVSFSNIETGAIGNSSLVFLVLILASVVPPLVNWLYNPEKQYIGHIKKSIQHALPDTELRILASAFRQDDATAAVKLFQYSNPTRDSPLSIYGLCLDPLIGSDLPLLINHQFGQKTSNEVSNLQTARETFQYLKAKNPKVLEVQLFTAISSISQMHEDICYLAFDRGISLIVLPFHKKWNSKGRMVSSSTELRDLNTSVLDRAPCSVGILIDRSKTRHLSSIFDRTTPFRVGILFIEGPDDREALAYALRMAGSSRVDLTVMHFISVYENSYEDKWEKMLDAEAIRTLKLQRSANIRYHVQDVRDGSDTAQIVRAMEKNYDHIIVGRRHDDSTPVLSGLSEWIELPELGPLGDMLASSIDNTSEASTLVIQQQIMKQSHSSILN